jgi:NIMA (never in mitosis gene a)-related kinase
MSLNEFEIIKELGKGAFGSVCKVKRKADGNIYAMKRVKISQLNSKERDNALNEVRILASLTHINIIGYKQAFFDEDSKTLNIVMELADDGDLESKIQFHIKNKTNFPETAIWSYLIQMTSGLKALHDNKIMHRDLKCANIFLMKDGTLKLGDLNVSKVVKMQLAYTQTGTPYYASPEVWSDKPYDYKSDLWSVGAVIYELCDLRPPFKGTSLQELYRNIMKGILSIIKRCL